MSGGRLDYFYSQLEEHSGDFMDKELDDLVKDLATLFYAREWYLSGDTNEGSWREARDAFKKKWFKDGARQERIEKYLSELKEELLDSLGLSEAYCRNCKHWTPEKDGPYGECDVGNGCLWHRSEQCKKFERGDAK